MAQQPIDKKYFAMQGEKSGRLNAEDAPFAIGQNEWVNRENCRIGSTDKGVTGTDESIGGTLRISQPSPSVSFIEIGSEPDIINNRTINFLCNLNTSEHKIEVYDKTVSILYLALLSSQVTGGLNFSKDYPITARVQGSLVIFNDNNNEPKCINIDSAIKMNNPSYVTNEVAYTSPLEVEVPYLIRYPPTVPLLATKQTSGGVTVNNVADFAGEFSWRFLFRNGRESVASTPSIFVNYNTPTETVNIVRVVADTAQHINQDVLQVDFCVKYGNSGTLFVIKSWNKNISSQAAEIIAHNAGITGLNYTFLNDKAGVALSSAYSYKPYDSVPLKSGTIELALQRLFLGNNLTSYNSPTKSSLSLSLTTVSTLPYQNPIHKSGADKKVGIVFRDRFKRVIGNVFTNDSLRITVPDRDYNYTNYVSQIVATLSNADAVNEIPVEAYYYEMVITKNLRTKFFVQAKSGQIKYALKDNTTGLYSYQPVYTSSAAGIAIDANLLVAAGMGYLFDPNSGDIAKIYLNNTATVYSLPVIAQTGNYIIVKLQDLGLLLTPTVSAIYEIYTPYKEIGDDPFYTAGLVFPVLFPTTNGRLYSFSAMIFYGDIYTYNRPSPNGAYVAENMASNPKYWKEWVGNWGELNINLISYQVRKNTAVQWSNVVIEGTQTNGLNSFDALDEKILPIDLGNLRKLQQTSKVEEQGNVMLAIGEQSTASLYLGEVQVVAASENAFLSSSPSVIGTVNILKGDFGTIDPESVVEYRGNVYWLDRNNGRYVQYSLNGLFPISNYKMARFWKLWCEQRNSMASAQVEALGGRPFVFSTVDPFHDELLISIPKLMTDPPKGYLYDYAHPNHLGVAPQIPYPFDFLDFQDKVIVYDLKESRWMGSFTFYSEGFVTLQNQLYSFRLGQFYLHNQFSNQCELYGVQQKPSIMFVSNVAPSNPKVYHNVAIEANIAPYLVLFYNNYPLIQQSDLVDFDFRNVEGNFCARIYRNRIVATAVGFNSDALLIGEVMRNAAMFIMVQFSVSGSNPLEHKFFNIGFIPSIGNTSV